MHFFRILFLLFLTGTSFISFAQDNEQRLLHDLIRKNAPGLGLSEEDANNAIISSFFSDPKTNIQYVYLQQAFKKIKVFNSIQTIVFRNNEVLYTSGRFFPGLSSIANNAIPSITATDAVIAAVAHLQLQVPTDLVIVEDRMNVENKIVLNSAGIARQPIEVTLFWVASENGSEIKLAWNVNIRVLTSPDWWNVRIDATSGDFIEKDNWTVNEVGEHHSSEDQHSLDYTGIGNKNEFRQQQNPPPAVNTASYRVVPFPFESPKHQNLALESDPWLKAGSSNEAITHGWHYDGQNNFNITRGNNVFAYLDVMDTDAPNSTTNWPDTSSSAIPSLSFTASPNFLQQPYTQTNQKSALTNLFYWNNIIHDISYQYGFTEASGNFQKDNIGRGGSGNDYVHAQAQDGSGTNNANFSTPPDGSSPGMQMYLWSPETKLIVNSPSSIAGNYNAVESAFSNSNKLSSTGPITGQVVYYNDNAAGTTHEACGGPPANSLTGKIVMIDRGTCTFVIKVKNAQNAGAKAVIMVNNVAGSPITMGGDDNSIIIPAVMISQSHGSILAGQIANGLNVTLSGGVELDADFDNGIIVHEYTHGISNRLTGGRNNASCLSNAEQGGEGWSDYLSLMLTTNWSTAQLNDGNLKRPIGVYATGQSLTGSGIRAYPYSTNMSFNPLTYDHLFTSTQVHFIGTVWCTALWEMTWSIIQQTGTIDPNIYNSNGTGGNVIALRLVMEGMRLQPCRPGFLDARDAILAADSILYNKAYKCAIWTAFAKRGMGFSAKQGLTNNASDQVPAYDVPSSVRLIKTSEPVTMSPGSQHSFTIAASCECQVPVNNYVIRDTIPNGFSYVSSSGGVLNGNVVTFSNLGFTAKNETRNFQITLKAENAGCIIDTAINDNRENFTAGGFASAIISGTTQWQVDTSRSKSPNKAWYAANRSTITDFTLTSMEFTPWELSVFTFWQYYVTDNRADGGLIEISTNGGTNWFDAAPYILQNGYNSTANDFSQWSLGQPFFSGVSYGQVNKQFIPTILDLSPLNGQQVRVRFRMRSNGSNIGTYEGWFLDDLRLMNGCGGILKTGLYNSSNVRIDSAAIPAFIISSALPIFIQSQPASVIACESGDAIFSITASSGSLPLIYQWQVSTDGGATYSNINGATQSTLTVSSASSSMNGYMYRCIVDNGTGTRTSAASVLTIGTAPVVNNITNSEICSGRNVVLTSTSNGQNLVYQWQVSTNGGTSFSDLPNGTTANLSLTNVPASFNGNLYRIIVTGSCGKDTSNNAILTVFNAPVVNITSIPTNLVCTSDPAFPLGATPAGGSWTGQGVSGNQFSAGSLTAGTYILSYTYTNTSGCSSSVSASVNVSSCADKMRLLDQEGAILVYPNPNSGKFFIRFKTSLYEKLQMNIYASDGKLVKVQLLSGLDYDVEVPVSIMDLADGLYLLSLYDSVSGREKTFKIVLGK